MRARVARMVIALVTIYVVLVLAVVLTQRRFIYFPTRFSEPAALDMARQNGFAPWRNASGAVIGWHLASAGSPTGSVLIVHGNGGCALNRDYLAAPLHAAGGLDVYVLEYPGYGCRGGQATMSTLLAAGEEAYRSLPGGRPIYVVAESLGTGVAAHLAKLYSAEIKGLVLFVPYDRLSSVAQHQMRWLPAAWLLRDRFAPAEWLQQYRGPIQFVIAENDSVIPARFGRRLYEGYAGPKKLQVVAGAGHNDVTEQPTEWWRETLAFLWRG